MSLDTGNQFNEAATSAADFDPQDQVLPNSPILSGDVNAIAERAIRRTRYLYETESAVFTSQEDLPTVGTGGGVLETFTVVGYTPSAYAFVDIAAAVSGDVIDASLTFDLQTSGPSGDFLLRLTTVEDFGGADTVTAIPGAAWVTRTATRIQTRLQGIRTITTAGPLRVRLEVSGVDGVEILNNYGTGSLIVRRTHIGA